jgi:hypothetical protein
MPGRGGNGLLTSGYNWGVIEGVATSYDAMVTRITPRAWKKKIGIPSKADKGYSILEASRRFQKEFHSGGQAEAALIGLSHFL